MTVFAAFGGSTNLLLHIPAIAFAAGLDRPTIEDWNAVNRKTPRLVDVLPNGPVGHPTVRAYLAGGVPEVMLHLRKLGLLDLNVLTVTGAASGTNARLVGAVGSASASAGRSPSEGRNRSRRRDYVPGPGPGARPDGHDHAPPGQPRPARLGDQEHGHRPRRWSMPMASIARPGRPASLLESEPPSRPFATAPCSRAISWR